MWLWKFRLAWSTPLCLRCQYLCRVYAKCLCIHLPLSTHWSLYVFCFSSHVTLLFSFQLLTTLMSDESTNIQILSIGGLLCNHHLVRFWNTCLFYKHSVFQSETRICLSSSQFQSQNILKICLSKNIQRRKFHDLTYAWEERAG